MRHDFWDADAYASASTTQTREATELLGLLIPRAGERILDIGCGDGRITAMIGAAGAQVVGLDRSPAMAAAAAAKGLSTTVGDAVALPFADASFDGIFSNAALQWVHDQGAAIREIARVLRSGGRLTLRAGGAGNQWRVITEVIRLLAEDPYDAYRPRGIRPPWRMADPAEWMIALVDAGMRVDELDLVPTRADWEGPEQMQAWLAATFHPLSGLLPDHLRTPFLETVVRRVWPSLDRDEAFVRLQVQAVRLPDHTRASAGPASGD